MQGQDLLSRIDNRSLMLLIIGSCVLIFTALTTYTVVPEVKRYFLARETLQLLNAAPPENRQLHTQVSQQRKEVTALEKQIRGDMAHQPSKQLESYIIESLQIISSQNHMQLSSLAPRKGQKIDIFREMIFDVELTGNYMNFYHWLSELNGKLGFIVISKFNIRPAAPGKQDSFLNIKLTITAYRSES